MDLLGGIVSTGTFCHQRGYPFYFLCFHINTFLGVYWIYIFDTGPVGSTWSFNQLQGLPPVNVLVTEGLQRVVLSEWTCLIDQITASSPGSGLQIHRKTVDDINSSKYSGGQIHQNIMDDRFITRQWMIVSSQDSGWYIDQEIVDD